MYAVEFQSTIREDGSIIVPVEYKDRVGKNVKVILLSGGTKHGEISSPNFSAVSIRTKGFKFDRDYANER